MVGLSIVKPNSMKDALALLNDDTFVIAGGTDVAVQVHAKPNITKLVDVNGILKRGIEETKDSVIIYALTTHTDVMESPVIAKWAPALKQACSQVAATQVRNMGTIGGNVANASPAGDSIPALLAVDAKVTYVDAKGEKTIALKEFQTGPGSTVMNKKGLITKFEFAKADNRKTAFTKVGKRNAMAISVVNCAVGIYMDGDRIEKANVILGSVAPKTLHVEKAEEYLVGRKFADVDLNVFWTLVFESINPIDDIRSTAAYRKQVAANVARRTLITAYEGGK